MEEEDGPPQPTALVAVATPIPTPAAPSSFLMSLLMTSRDKASDRQDIPAEADAHTRATREVSGFSLRPSGQVLKLCFSAFLTFAL